MQTFSTTLAAAIAAGNPQRVLFEFTHDPDGTAYNPTVCFSNEDILITDGVRLREEFNPDTDLSIGQCPSAEISFEMLNNVGQIAGFEFGTFTAWLGARIDSGTPASGAKTKTFTENGVSRLYEFSPLGTFIAQRPDVVMQKTISVDANDQMTLFDVDMPSNTDLNITFPITLYNLTSAMCSYVGVTLKPSSWLNSDISVAKRPDGFDSATMREVLKWVAEAACSIARFARDGELEFKWWGSSVKTYDENNYSEFSATWYETEAIDGLHIRNADSTTEFTVGTDDNPYLIQDNPFLKQSGS